ncbi:FKBP-type peptidyl-prolyl cis-trans isomerase [Psychromonas sp. MME2]|uniref:FKBP-type peptidyl-prolyl cis-trans isomerase n=1 Tax=unclassified Psychromonas TaxID=2614957 RepID=UPI00339C1670
MKNVFKVSLLAAAVALTVGCNEKAEAVTEAAATETAAATFATNQEKVAYAVGQSFSEQFNTMLDKQTEIGMPLDKEMVLKGITDTLRGTAKLSDEEMMTTLKAYGEEVKAVAEKKMLEDAAKAAEEEKAFLEANAKVEGVMVTDSGLQYSVITKAEGEGQKPKAEDTVTVHYVGTLVDGTEFDSSIKRGQPATFPLNRVIPGWTEGLQLMSVGDKFKFVIPADLAYGDQGAGSIPANSTLIFDVELLDIESAAIEDNEATEEAATE